MIPNRYWKIAVHAPIKEHLTYLSDLALERGQWVLVPLGKRQTLGLVVGPADTYEKENLKSVIEIDTSIPQISETYMNWLVWLSEYYQYPLGLVAELSRPALEKKKSNRISQRPEVVPLLEPDFAPELTNEQKNCLNEIKSHKNFQVHLVHGVTGSGKTEIYLNLLEKTLKQNQSAIVLVPEIALTPQLIQRFAKRFGNKIAAFHSQMTPREKTNHWWDIVEGRKQIMIGARSALFCPQNNLGLIIVDEEHEPSYKQDDKLKYHARDAAVMLGHFSQCQVILGSATPSLESWHNSQLGKYHLHQLKSRVHTSGLPEVEVIDLREEKNKVQDTQIPLPSWLSKSLYSKISQVLADGYQAALFLNRRGMANVVMCNSCGHSIECPNCDINLTLHSKSHLVCHYCDYHENLKENCPSCKLGEMSAVGLGTEKLEQELKTLFPDKTIVRADRDEIQNREDLENFIQDVESGKADLLVGTQMIAKGLDFPKLKLVGLVLADIGFNLPDFRANERNFQLIVQMSGRPGRHLDSSNNPGQVVIQTFNPEHESLKYAIQHDFEGFVDAELMHRKALLYPPYGRLISLKIQSPDRMTARNLASTVSQRALSLKSHFSQYESLEVLGPAEAPIAKLKNQYRYHLLLKGQGSQALQSFIKQLMGDEKWIPSRSRIIVDIDPLHLI